MTIKELQDKITECRKLYDKFETAHKISMGHNNAFSEWLGEIEQDMADDALPEKIREMLGHNLEELGLYERANAYSDVSREYIPEQYENDRKYVNERCIQFRDTYRIYKSVGFVEKNTVLVGANGSGKTTLANKLKETLNIEDGIVIPAQKLLVVPTFDNIPTYKAEKDPFKAYQKRILDDKRTFRAKSQDDFPYDIAKEYGSEYRKVLALLIAERNSKRNEVLDNKPEGDIFHRTEIRTTIDVVIEIWNDLIPHRKMSLDTDSNLIISYISNGEEKQYEAYKMSDGERIILYLVGRVMQAPKNSLVIVDEPEIYLHRTVVDKL